ncbi:MAG: hypothetical protein CMF52_01815 [Legionellales bacterium]|nr:hypothetical protein [Legionellales bacterium]HAV93398.1 hypothetical protein [Pseudomonadota bacterium]
MQSTSKNKLIALLLLSSTTAFGGDHYMSATSNIGFKTDYLFRGISQTRRNPAVQGGFDFSTKSGYYIGTWASNVDFGDTANTEFDLYGGFTSTFSNDMSYDIGVLGYFYPGTSKELNYNTGEVYASLSKAMGQVSGTLSYNYSPDFYSTGPANYLHMSIDAPTGIHDLSMNAGLGYQTIDDSVQYQTGDYMDYALGIAYAMKQLTIGLTYHNTHNCDLTNGTCDSQLVMSLSTSHIHTKI